MAYTEGNKIYAASIPDKSEGVFQGLKDIFIHLKILIALSGKNEFNKWLKIF